MLQFTMQSPTDDLNNRTHGRKFFQQDKTETNPPVVDVTMESSIALIQDPIDYDHW